MGSDYLASAMSGGIGPKLDVSIELHTYGDANKFQLQLDGGGVEKKLQSKLIIESGVLAWVEIIQAG